MSTIYTTTPLFPDLIEQLETAGHEVLIREGWGDAQALEAADALICLLNDRVDPTRIAACSHQLKIIANVAVGYENIDVDAARTSGIVVTNTPDVLTESTADHVFALLLASARRVVEADAAVRQGAFPAWGLDQAFTGLDVHGKTLGIVGLGRIGAAVARRGRLGFGMSIYYCTRTRRPDLEHELDAQHVSLEHLLETADFVVVLVPLTGETHHMIDRKAFLHMKPTAILVNASRGPVVDESALVAALRAGELAGAGLDVFEQEPEVHPGLRQCSEHVTLTPHLGSATRDTRHAMAQLAVDNVLAVLDGNPPLTPVS